MYITLYIIIMNIYNYIIIYTYICYICLKYNTITHKYTNTQYVYNTP